MSTCEHGSYRTIQFFPLPFFFFYLLPTSRYIPAQLRNATCVFAKRFRKYLNTITSTQPIQNLESVSNVTEKQTTLFLQLVSSSIPHESLPPPMASGGSTTNDKHCSIGSWMRAFLSMSPRVFCTLKKFELRFITSLRPRAVNEKWFTTFVAIWQLPIHRARTRAYIHIYNAVQTIRVYVQEQRPNKSLAAYRPNIIAPNKVGSH